MRSSNILFLISLLFATASCEFSEESKNDVNQSFSDPNQADDVDVVAPIPEELCYAKRFRQPDAEITKKIDILFVADTSGSLNDERKAIAEGIDAFIEVLPKDVDYRIAVNLAHGDNSSWMGRLYQEADEAIVLSSETHSLDQVRSGLSKKLSRGPSDYWSDGGEVGSYSLSRLIGGSRLSQAQSQGFFRSDAALAVVFIADENDICAVYPEGITPVYDGDKLEAGAKDRYCDGITKQSVFNGLKSLKGELPLLISSIIYVDPEKVPAGAENEVGYGYMELTELSGGVLVELADGDYELGLGEIGTLASIKLKLEDEFELSEENINSNSISVRVDGGVSPFNYIEESRTIHLLEPGYARSLVDIEYCLIKEDESDSGGGDDMGSDGGEDSSTGGGGDMGSDGGEDSSTGGGGDMGSDGGEDSSTGGGGDTGDGAGPGSDDSGSDAGDDGDFGDDGFPLDDL